ncbi:MAG: hypothetical protein ABIC68_06575 [Candidatus Omnitrophota bacterium]
MTFNGASDQTVTPGGTDANHDFQNIMHTGAGNFILGGAIDIDGTLTQNNSGSDIDPSASNYAITAANVTLTDGTINTNSRTGVWTISGNLTISSGTLKAPTTITVGGNWANADTFTHNSGEVVLNTSAASTISGDSIFHNLTCTTADKTLNFAFDATQTIEGVLTLTGEEDHLITLARFGGSGLDQFNLNVTGSSSVSYVSVSNSNASGDLISAYLSTDGGNNANWEFTGTGYAFSGTVYSDAGTTPIGANITVAIAVNGAPAVATAQTNVSGEYAFSGVAVSDGDVIIVYIDGETQKGSAVTVVSASDLSALNIYQDHVIVRHDYTTGYTTNANLATADNADPDIKYSVVDNNLTVNADQTLLIWVGDTYQPTGNVTGGNISIEGTVTAGSNIFTISGNFAKSGTFGYDTSTVTFNDSSRASIISGSTTFYNLTSTTPAKVLTFTRGTTQTVVKKITVTGAAAEPIEINDTGVGAVPKLTVESGATQAITNVKVTNNDASGGIELIAQGAASTLSGSTANWVLGSAGGRFLWRGTISSQWSDPLNWNLGMVPTQNDEAIIDAGAPHQPRLDIPARVKTLEVDSGTTFDTGGQSLSILSHMVLNGTLNAGNSTITITGNITSSGTGVIQGVSPALAVGGYIGTKDVPIELSVTGAATISAGGMNNMVSVSINGGSSVDYNTSIPGFVFINGRVDDKLGQSQIRSALETGASKMFLDPFAFNGMNSSLGLMNISAFVAGAPSAPVIIPMVTPMAIVPATPVVSAQPMAQAPVQTALPIVAKPVVPKPSFEGVDSKGVSVPQVQSQDFQGVVSQLAFQPVIAQREFSGIMPEAQLVTPRVFDGTRAMVQLPKTRENVFGFVSVQEFLPEALTEPVFKGVMTQAVFQEPVISKSLLKEMVVLVALPQAVNKEFFEAAAPSSSLPDRVLFQEMAVSAVLPQTVNKEFFESVVPRSSLPDSVSFKGVVMELNLPAKQETVSKFSFEGAGVMATLPSVMPAQEAVVRPSENLQKMFTGVKSELMSVEPLSREVFKGVVPVIKLPTRASFEGISSQAVLPQQLMKSSFQGVGASVELPSAVIVNKVALEKAGAKVILSHPVNPHVFGDVTGEMRVKVVFPGGQQIMPVHGIGVPLGAEKPLLEPRVKAREED